RSLTEALNFCIRIYDAHPEIPDVRFFMADHNRANKGKPIIR
ncbi:hypothetical protein M2133_003170, partial [Parabacteroides sp. PF5-6]|nr:hypothetical protein [Parabacteroides sp. PF5-6]